jgi:hypothetical protein
LRSAKSRHAELLSLSLWSNSLRNAVGTPKSSVRPRWLSCFFILEKRRKQAEVGAVSAYISEDVLHNDHDSGSGRGIHIAARGTAAGNVKMAMESAI